MILVATVDILLMLIVNIMLDMMLVDILIVYEIVGVMLVRCWQPLVVSSSACDIQ